MAEHVRRDSLRMVPGEHVVDARDQDELRPRQELGEAPADAEAG